MLIADGWRLLLIHQNASCRPSAGSTKLPKPEARSEHQTRCGAQALLLSDTLKQAEMQLKSRKSGEASWVDIPDCYDALRWFVLPQELAAELRIKVAG